MTAAGLKKEHKKRKQVDDEVPEPSPFVDAVGLEMLSEEEDEDAVSGSDDGEVDEFPEIDTRSDSEDEKYEGGQEDSNEEEDEEDEEENSSASDADSDLHIFPESKTIISNITGQPKRVYPEIEPDYDSDSSTEDVWFL
jgi:ribosome biogenesis protein ERB1